MTSDDFEGWYCLRVRPHHEAWVVDELRALDIASYLPQETKWRRSSHARVKTKRRVSTPLFPGYLFVDIRIKGDFFAAENVRGSIEFYRSVCGRPLRVMERELGWVRDAEERGRFNYTDRERDATKGALATGQLVKIADGPMAGFMGLIEKGGERAKFRALVSMFGRQIAAEFDAHHLQAA